MKIRVNVLTLSVLLLTATHSFAQLKIPGTGNADLKQALEKVISDFPNGFAKLKGEVLNTNPQTVEYTSLLSFKSAQENVITQHSGKPPVYSWQALMHTTEEFEEATKKYKSLYSQLKNTNITLNRDYSYGLSGVYSKPDESKRFCNTVFALLPNAINLPKVKVELSLQYELMEWKIYLLVYQKEKEDDERGSIED